MSLIPFKTKVKDTHTHLVADGLGTELEVPKYGSLTYNESEMISTLINKNPEQYAFDPIYKADFVCLLLLLRYKQEITALPWDDDRSSWDTLKHQLLTVDEIPLPEAMVDALYTYFNEEQRRHIPSTQLLRVDGKDGEKLVTDYAEQHEAVAATRPDLERLNIYFVFKSVLNVETLNLGESDLTKWRIIKSFEPLEPTHPEAVEEEAPKKKRLTGAVATGS